VISQSPKLAGKRLELLRETVPGVSSVAVLGPPTHEDWKEIAFAALQQRVRLQALQVRKPDQFEKAFEDARREHAKALIVLPSPTTNYYPEKIVSHHDPASLEPDLQLTQSLCKLKNLKSVPIHVPKDAQRTYTNLRGTF
jgi:hypothetical protein